MDKHTHTQPAFTFAAIALALACLPAVAATPTAAAATSPATSPLAASTLAPTAKATSTAAPARAVNTPASARRQCSEVQSGPVIRLSVGKSHRYRPVSPVARIVMGNPEGTDAKSGAASVNALLLGPNEIFLQARSQGSTNILMLGRDGRCTMLDVAVGADPTPMQGAIDTMLPGLSGKVQVTPAAGSLILSGTVRDATQVDKLVQLAGAFVGSSGKVINMLGVEDPQQVMLEVKVAEVSKTVLDKLGVNLTAKITSGDWSYRILNEFLKGGSIPPQLLLPNPMNAGYVPPTLTNPTPFPIPGAPPRIGNGQFPNVNSIGGAHSSGNRSFLVDAQKDDGLVKILAEPTVLALSGHQGSFLAGGKILVPVSQSNQAGGTTNTLEEKEFGVGLSFTPTVLEGGKINLVVNPEVSELSREGVTLVSNSSGAVLPLITTRRASTTVQLRDGQSFAIGGLVKNNVTTNVSAFPFLGELPILGALFRSTSFQTDKSELLFVVTPRLVKPLDGDYKLPTDNYIPPNRAQLMLGGKLEGTLKNAPAAGQN